MRKAALAVTCIVVLCLESVLAFLFGVLLFQERYSYTNFVGLSFIIAGMSFLHGDDT
jgi:small multidrug resistance pump/quaternary ammonium compound-resistance protein SugE